MAVLAALAPSGKEEALTGSEAVLGGVPFAAVPWLLYFSQIPYVEADPACFFNAWAVLLSVASVMAMTVGVDCLPDVHRIRLAEFERRKSGRGCVEVACQWLRHAVEVRTAVLFTTFPVVLLLQVTHYHVAFTEREFVAYLLIMLAFATLWYVQGRRRKHALCFYLAEGAVFAVFFAVRRQLVLTYDAWDCNYDIWVALAASFIIAASKRMLDARPAEERAPAVLTLCAMPLVSMLWVVVNHLGVNTALIVLALNGMIFAFLGREDRQSPYNIGAVVGFLSFVLLLFWGKLGLAALHAYVIPTGIGVIVLLHLFRDSVRADVRNQVRMITVVVMLCCSAYYAFADHTYTWLQIAVMGILSLAVMTLGVGSRIKMYLLCGFGGFMVTIIFAMTKAFILYAVDRNVKMTIIGSTIFLVGVLLVAGAVYARTHQEMIQAFAARCRKLLGEWE